MNSARVSNEHSVQSSVRPSVAAFRMQLTQGPAGDWPAVVLPLLPTTPRAVMFPLLLTTPPPPRPPRKLLRFKLLARAFSRKHWRQNLARDDAVCLPQPSVAQAMCVTFARLRASRRSKQVFALKWPRIVFLGLLLLLLSCLLSCHLSSPVSCSVLS